MSLRILLHQLPKGFDLPHLDDWLSAWSATFFKKHYTPREICQLPPKQLQQLVALIKISPCHASESHIRHMEKLFNREAKFYLYAVKK